MDARNVAPAPGHQLPFWQWRRCYPDRARLYRQSHCAVEGQRLLTLLAQHVTFERYQSGESPVPEPLFVVTTHLPDALRISSGS